MKLIKVNYDKNRMLSLMKLKFINKLVTFNESFSNRIYCSGGSWNPNDSFFQNLKMHTNNYVVIVIKIHKIMLEILFAFLLVTFIVCRGVQIF